MERMKKIASNLDLFVKIIMYGNIASGGLLLLVSVVMAAEVSMDRNAIRDYLVLNLGNMKVGLSPEYAPEVSYTNVRFFLGMMLGVGICCFIIYAAKVARTILKPMKEGLPFDDTVSRNLKKLGVLTLVGGMIWSVTNAVLDTINYNAYDMADLFRPEKITEVELSITLDTKFIIIAAVIFLLSYIFQYGAELQKLSDETL